MIGNGNNPVLDHAWGVSLAADRIWAQIAGIAPSAQPWKQPFVTLQAAIDESYNKCFVLGGYIATAERWANFAMEWETLLPLATVSSSGRHRFKMSEMAYRLEDVQTFYRVIEKHVSMAVSVAFDLGDLSRAIDRVWVENVPLDWFSGRDPHHYPFMLAFAYLLIGFHQKRVNKDFAVISQDSAIEIENLLSIDKEVIFYFDNNTLEDAVLESWRNFLEINPNSMRALYGAMPRFDDDEKFLPLQAADFWAWWTRRGYESGTINQIHSGDFGVWKEQRHIPVLSVLFSEDDIVRNLMYDVRRRLKGTRPVFDAKFHPRPKETPQEKLSFAQSLFRWFKG